jgi:hypothetical protein
MIRKIIALAATTRDLTRVPPIPSSGRDLDK